MKEFRDYQEQIMAVEKEHWRGIPNYTGIYEASSLGRIRNVKTGRILKPEYVRGYFRNTLSKDNIQERFQTHRLVALCFIENPKNKPCVNHVDGVKTNNAVENLDWCTYSENERHSYDTIGKVNKNRKLSKEAVADIRSNLIKGLNTKDFMKKYSVCRKTVLNVKNNKYYD
jgi:hypothetical protein